MHIGSGIGEGDWIAGLDQLATALEDDECGLAVEPRGKAQGAGIAAFEEIGGDRLGDDPPPRGDLVQVQVRQAVLDLEGCVALLEVGADRRIG
jgi:hypothetical protein